MKIARDDTDMRKKRVFVVSDSVPVAASIKKTLQLLDHEIEVCERTSACSDQVESEVEGSCDWMLIDLNNCRGITPYIHLASFETLPTILFANFGTCLSDSKLSLEEAVTPTHSYLVNKYHKILSQVFNISANEFLNRHFCSLLHLNDLLRLLSYPPKTGVRNMFCNVSQILTDFDMVQDTEILSRLPYLDSDLYPDSRERALNRLKEFHAESSVLEKRMVADLITDNVRYIQGDEPIRRLLWIEDRPDRTIDNLSAKSTCENTLRDLVTRCFGYYRNMSVLLMQKGFEELISRLHRKLRSPRDSQGGDKGLFYNLELEQICGQHEFSRGLELDDCEAVLLDLYFEEESQISGTDFIVPLAEVSPETPILIFSRSGDPEVIDSVLRSGGDFYINKSYPSAVPVFVNRCYDGEVTNLFFIEKSRARQYLLNNRYDVRIRIDTTDELAYKATPSNLNTKGAILLAEGLEQKDEEEGEFVFKMRNMLRWREVYIYTDEVEGLGCFVEFQGPSEKTVDKALTHFELDTEQKHTATYLQLCRELNCPGWLKGLRRFHDKFGELVFGSTSGILTTIGMLLGVYVAVEKLSSVMASIAAVAASDSWSDAYSIYSAKLAERGTSGSEAFRFAFKTFLGKVFFPLFFMLVLWLADLSYGNLQTAVFAVLILGVMILATMSAERPLVLGKGTWGVVKEVGKNILLACVVLLCSGAAGYVVNLLFPDSGIP